MHYLLHFDTKKYVSIKSISKNPENLTLNANLENSRIGFKDVLLLVPDLNRLVSCARFASSRFGLN